MEIYVFFFFKNIMATTNKSIEERIEDIAKNHLKDIKVNYYAKNDSINNEINAALTKAPSKSGGKGPNYPDIKVLL